MTDDLTRLRTTLAQLRDELEKVEAADPEIQELLSGAVADIQETISRRSGETAEKDSSIVDRLSEAAQHYEQSHPTLSTTLGNIIDALSRLGI